MKLKETPGETASYMVGTPIGIMRITISGPYLVGLTFQRESASDFHQSEEQNTGQRVWDLDALEEAYRIFLQLKEYFNGQRREFSIPLAFQGPSFYRKVWEELMKIPYGQVRTYSQLAEAAGSLKAARAVGTACAQNPIAIIIPCHRVVAQTGLGGYGGGLPAKKWLLALEKKETQERDNGDHEEH